MGKRAHGPLIFFSDCYEYFLISLQGTEKATSLHRVAGEMTGVARNYLRCLFQYHAAVIFFE